MIPEKSPSNKDRITAIKESLNYFDKEYCFELVLILLGMDFTVIKAQRVIWNSLLIVIWESWNHFDKEYCLN